MKAIVKGKNVEVPDRVREYADRKLARIERLLDERSDASIEIWTEAHRSNLDSHIVEVTLFIDGQMLRSRAAGPTYQAGIDAVIDRIERRAIDHKEKPRLRSQPIEEKAILNRIADGTADGAAEVGHERRVVKVKRFGIEPMFEEDAIARMEELGHAFFVFVNAENEHLNVLYRRRDGNLGLIEPVVGGGYTAKGNGSSRTVGAARGG